MAAKIKNTPPWHVSPLRQRIVKETTTLSESQGITERFPAQWAQCLLGKSRRLSWKVLCQGGGKGSSYIIWWKVCGRRLVSLLKRGWSRKKNHVILWAKALQCVGHTGAISFSSTSNFAVVPRRGNKTYGNMISITWRGDRFHLFAPKMPCLGGFRLKCVHEFE